MKLFRLFTALLLTLVMSVGFVSCGKDANLDSSKLVGKWYVTRMKGYERPVNNPEAVQNFDASVTKGDMYLSFMDDKSFEQLSTGDGESFFGRGTWSLSGADLTLSSSDEVVNALVLKLSKDNFEFSIYNKEEEDGVLFERFQYYYLEK